MRYGTLPNGMRYALRHNATPPHQTSLRLRIDAGSLEEQDDQRGLAHFIEHMAFNGSTHVPEGEFVHRLERLGLRFGADTNAGTEFTQTVYKLDLPESKPASIDEGLFLLREVAGEVSFAPAAIDRERGIVQSEERSRAGPQYRIFVDQMNYLLRGQSAAEPHPDRHSRSDRHRPARPLRRLLRRLLPARARDPDRGRRFQSRRDGGQDPRPLRRLARPAARPAPIPISARSRRGGPRRICWSSPADRRRSP